MGRIKRLSAAECLKFLGQLQLADFCLLVVPCSWYLPGVQLRLRSSLCLMLVFTVRRKVTERSSIVCLGLSEARGSSGCSREVF